MTLLFALFLIAAMLLVAAGIYSLVATRNMIRILISVELLTKAVTLLMIGAGYMTDQVAQAQSYVISIIVIEVMLLVIAVGIVFGVYKKTGSLDPRSINNLKG